MRTSRGWGAVVLSTVFASCQCGSPSSPDGGTAGGVASTGGGTNGGTSGGATGGGTSGGGSVGGGTVSCTVSPGTLPLEDVCAALLVGARGLQKSTQTSCGEPIQDADLPFLAQLDVGTCAPDGGFFANALERLAQKLDAGRMAYDPVSAHACQALGRLNGGRPGLTCPNNPCEQVFRGLVPLGGACDDSEDCTGELFCRPTGETSCVGRCAARLSPGAACNPDRDLCERGSPCRAADGGFRCLVRAGVGGRCADEKDCQPNLGCANGSCATRQPVGSACLDTSGHADCLPELGCVRVGSARTCQPRAQLGGSCDRAGNGAPPCVTSECVECNGGRCIAAGITGAPCTGPTDCRGSFFCGDAGTCVFRARRGEPCQVLAAANPQGSCLYPADFCSVMTPGSAGTCQPKPNTGEPCGAGPGLSSQCQQADDFCRVPSGASGACANKPVAPEACGRDAGLSPTCREGKCLAGACVAPTAPGTPCTVNDANCRGDAFCDDTVSSAPVCALKRAAGAACTTSEQCADGLCDRTTNRCSVACSTTFDNEGASCAVGCPNGLRDGATLLLFSMVLTPLGRRRRSR